MHQQSSVVDLCCGPATLYQRYLRHKNIQYTGLDINSRFVKRLSSWGATGIRWDLRETKPFPPADYLIMQSSLYQFLPDPRPVLNRMLVAARKQVIITEPIRASGKNRSPSTARYGRRAFLQLALMQGDDY